MLRKNPFLNRVTDPWNDLASIVIDAPSVKYFERRLDKFWQNHPLRYDFKASCYYTHYDSHAQTINTEDLDTDMELAEEAERPN